MSVVSSEVSFKDKIKDSLNWWLSKRKEFIINDEYKLELLHIDRIHNSAKIRITNLKNGTIQEMSSEVSNEGEY
jgi:hypothetical protein